MIIMLRSEVHSTRDVFTGVTGLKNSYDMSLHSPRQHLPGSKKSPSCLFRISCRAASYGHMSVYSEHAEDRIAIKFMCFHIWLGGLRMNVMGDESSLLCCLTASSIGL